MNDRIRVMQRQPRRISITLSYNVHEDLLNRSEEEVRSVSNLCAFLLEESLKGAHQQRVPNQPQAHPPSQALNGMRPQLKARSY